MKTENNQHSLFLFLKKSLQYVVVFFVLIVAFTFIIAFLAQPYNIKKGRTSIINKTKRLQSIQIPKIIIIGGSNANYGLNSKLLEDSLKKPVVNFSLNMEIGLGFMINLIKNNINKNDWVIVLPEYLYFDPSYNENDYVEIYQIITSFPMYIKYLSANELIHFPFFLNKLNAENIDVIGLMARGQYPINRFQFNKYGDYVGHLKEDTFKLRNQTYKNFKRRNISYKKLNSKTLEEFNSLKESCNKKGAQLFLDYPVYQNILIDETLPQIMKTEMPNFNWIGSFKTYTYDSTFLFDTPYHLKFKFRDERSNKLVKDIKNYLSIHK